MARIGDLHVSIDADQYHQLPPDVRVRFDGWLKAETLMDRKVVRLTLGEGQVTIERVATDDNGEHFLGPNGKLALTTEVVPVRTTPPREAFERP